MALNPYSRVIQVVNTCSIVQKIDVEASWSLVPAHPLALGSKPLCVCCGLYLNYSERRSELPVVEAENNAREQNCL